LSEHLSPTFSPQVPGREFRLLTWTEIERKALARGRFFYLGLSHRGYSLSTVSVDVLSTVDFGVSQTWMGGGSVTLECAGWVEWHCAVVRRSIH